MARAIGNLKGQQKTTKRGSRMFAVLIFACPRMFE